LPPRVPSSFDRRGILKFFSWVYLHYSGYFNLFCILPYKPSSNPSPFFGFLSPSSHRPLVETVDIRFSALTVPLCVFVSAFLSDSLFDLLRIFPTPNKPVDLTIFPLQVLCFFVHFLFGQVCLLLPEGQPLPHLFSDSVELSPPCFPDLAFSPVVPVPLMARRKYCLH